jgi:predicted transcriptional regulator
VAGSTQTAVTVIGSRVPADFAERVREAAAAEDRSVSNFIKRAVEHEVQRVDAERTAA